MKFKVGDIIQDNTSGNQLLVLSVYESGLGSYKVYCTNYKTKLQRSVPVIDLLYRKMGHMNLLELVLLGYCLE